MERDKQLTVLMKVLETASSIEEYEAFLLDFFSPAEIKQFAERWEIMSSLLDGKTQRVVKEENRVSISKVSRGSYTIQYGRGGIRAVWENFKK